MELKIPPVLLTLLFGLLMWLASLLPPVFVFPAWLRISASSSLIMAGLFIGLAAVASFRKARTTVNPMTPDASSSLVDTGIFGFTRNPMYLSLLLALTGWSVFLASPWSMALAIVFVIYMNQFQIKPEERALQAAFGERFISYKHKVPRWL